MDGKDHGHIVVGHHLPVELIENILGKLCFSEVQILQYRTVCKTWNAEICRILKSRIVAQLKDPDKLPDLLTLQKNAEVLDLPTLIGEIELKFDDGNAPNFQRALLQASSPLPVTKITYTQRKGQATPRESLWIFGTFSLTLTHLTLRNLKQNFDPEVPENPEFLEKFGFLATDNHCLEGLRNLKVELFGIRPEDIQLLQHSQFLEFIRTIVIKCPLQNLTLTTDRGLRSPLSDIQMGSFPAPQLRHLEMHPQSVIYREILNQSTMPPLKSLVLTCPEIASETKLLEYCEVLSQLASTLEYFELLCGTSNNFNKFSFTNWKEEFPVFPRLQCFYACCDLRLDDYWLTQMPLLRDLWVQEVDLRVVPEPSGELPIYSKVVRFRCDRVKVLDEDSEQVTKAVVALRRTFPEVRCWPSKKFFPCSASEFFPVEVPRELDLELVIPTESRITWRGRVRKWVDRLVWRTGWTKW